MPFSKQERGRWKGGREDDGVGRGMYGVGGGFGVRRKDTEKRGTYVPLWIREEGTYTEKRSQKRYLYGVIRLGGRCM